MENDQTTVGGVDVEGGQPMLNWAHQFAARSWPDEWLTRFETIDACATNGTLLWHLLAKSGLRLVALGSLVAQR